MMKELMSSKKVFYILLGVNFIVTFLIFVFCIDRSSGDQGTYLRLADSLWQGKYTFWSDCQDLYFPDTFRNPGYPLFLALFLGLGANLFVIKLAQFLLLCISYVLFLKLLHKHGNSLLTSNIFLILTLLAPYVTIYIDMIFPEILMLFLIILVIYLDDFLQANLYKAFLLGLLYGFIFQVRPAFLFLPFILILYNWYSKAKEANIAYTLVVCLTFVATMLPYGIWNYKNHGKFSITSLEGGAGVMYLSYWAPRMPDYRETRYWKSVMGDEIINFIDPRDREKEIERYNKEWDRTDAALQPFITKKDSVMLNCFNDHPDVFKTYSSAYTLERERLLNQLTMTHIREDFWFMVKVKLYTLPRLWVTGIHKRDLGDKNVISIVKAIIPFLLTFIPFFLFILVSLWVWIRKIKPGIFLSKNYLFLLYFGVIHIPFVIQARYTTPVRFVLFMIIAILLGNFLIKPKKNTSAHSGN